MFGYVRPIRERLPEMEWERYRAAYCGLCHALGRRYGPAARFTLNYDFTFLAILLSPPEEPQVERGPCMAHPLRGRPFCGGSGALELAADESVILTWHKLADDGADRRGLSALPPRAAALAFRGAYRRSAALRPAFDRCVRENLERLRLLEEARAPSIDRPADAFAAILRAAAEEVEEEGRRRALEQLLYHLGRWIYLVDAWDDLEEDLADGRYNPMAVRYGGDPRSHREEAAATMTHSIRLCLAAAALLDLGPWKALVENVLYLGLPSVQRLVLAGQGSLLRKKTGRMTHD